MKKFTLSIAAVMAMGTFAIAGGDVTPTEAPMAADASGLYMGIAYGIGKRDSL